MESDARTKAAVSNEAYKQQLTTTNNIRTDFYKQHLPQILRVCLKKISILIFFVCDKIS